MKKCKMKSRAIVAGALVAALSCFAEDAQIERGKLELLVDEAHELLSDANRKGSETHTPACQHYFGLMYVTGTNLLGRSQSVANTQLCRKYMKLVEKNYAAYTKVENAAGMAVATGAVRGKSGARHRAKRLANAEKLRDKELANAIREWEAFAVQVKKSR